MVFAACKFISAPGSKRGLPTVFDDGSWDLGSRAAADLVLIPCMQTPWLRPASGRGSEELELVSLGTAQQFSCVDRDVREAAVPQDPGQHCETQ